MATLHRCHNCGCETEISSVLAAYEENGHCRQCGLSVNESDGKMQDELVSMMCQHMQLNSIQQPVQEGLDGSMPSTPQVTAEPAPITYITQHYHHSGHQVSVEEQASSLLDAAGVDTSALLPSQISLFKNGDNQQKQRLIELWLLAPPRPGSQFPGMQLTNWPQTSMELEKEAARRRWEMAEQEKVAQAEPYMVSMYSHPPHSTLQARHEQHEQHGQHGQHGRHDVMQGEEHRSFKDPVYNSQEWWKLSEQEPIEHQYGLMQAMMYGNGIEYPVAVARDDDMDML